MATCYEVMRATDRRRLCTVSNLHDANVALHGKLGRLLTGLDGHAIEAAGSSGKCDVLLLGNTRGLSDYGKLKFRGPISSI